MTERALEIKDLKKRYEDGFEALKGVTLSVEQGAFCALLGPNGAGKSTTINIISSLLRQTSGAVNVFGYDLEKNREEVKRCIGLVPQEFNFNVFEKVERILMTQAAYYGVPRAQAKDRVKHYLHRLGLWEKRHVPGKMLSGGMKRRLLIARALIHHPKLLILDEPTAGVDIELRRSMWDFLKEINDTLGTTIILTTHYLEEAEYLCRQIAIIDAGQIVANTDKQSLLQTLDTEIFVLTPQTPLNELPHIPGFGVEWDNERNIEVKLKKGQNLNEIFHCLDAQNIRVSSMRNKHNRLEELFIQLTGAA